MPDREGYPIASIVKLNLRPHGTPYHRLHHHFALGTRRSPGRLAQCGDQPPRKDLIWFGDRVPTAEDLKPFRPAVAPAVDSPGIISSLTLCTT